MGLDIIAFEHVKPVRGHHNRVDCDLHWVAYTLGFPHSLRGLESGRCYDVSGQELAFRPGSYTTYSEWRDRLAWRAAIAHPTDPCRQPGRFHHTRCRRQPRRAGPDRDPGADHPPSHGHPAATPHRDPHSDRQPDTGARN